MFLALRLIMFLVDIYVACLTPPRKWTSSYSIGTVLHRCLFLRSEKTYTDHLYNFKLYLMEDKRCLAIYINCTGRTLWWQNETLNSRVGKESVLHFNFQKFLPAKWRRLYKNNYLLVSVMSVKCCISFSTKQSSHRLLHTQTGELLVFIYSELYIGEHKYIT